MDKAIVTFSNGDTLELRLNQIIKPIVKLIVDDDITVSMGKPYELYYHIHDGLIPSIAELLAKCEFFQLPDDDRKIYKTSAVVSVEII